MKKINIFIFDSYSFQFHVDSLRFPNSRPFIYYKINHSFLFLFFFRLFFLHSLIFCVRELCSSYFMQYTHLLWQFYSMMDLLLQFIFVFVVSKIVHTHTHTYTYFIMTKKKSSNTPKWMVVRIVRGEMVAFQTCIAFFDKLCIILHNSWVGLNVLLCWVSVLYLYLDQLFYWIHDYVTTYL